MESPEVEILKSLWTRLPDGRFIIHTLNSVKLRPKSGFDSSYFQFETGFEMLTNTPPQNIHDLFSSFGSTDFILKQSILPVVSWVKGDDFIKCIGTAFLISCSGYVVTASHVLLDPQESGYKGAKIEGQTLRFDEDLMMGVLIPFNPASGNNGFRLLQFENAWYWGEWRESPLIHEDERFYGITDVAICKIPLEPHLGVFQPLAMSLEPFKKEETAYAIGYAEMKNILVRYNAQNEPIIDKFDWTLYVSVGEITNVLPDNHIDRVSPTPGPCFNFSARIPGKMSGAPIFGGKGAVIRGVVSRSFSHEKHASGCMLGPVMSLPFPDGGSLRTLMIRGNDGVSVIRGL